MATGAEDWETDIDPPVSPQKAKVIFARKNKGWMSVAWLEAMSFSSAARLLDPNENPPAAVHPTYPAPMSSGARLECERSLYLQTKAFTSSCCRLAEGWSYSRPFVYCGRDAGCVGAPQGLLALMLQEWTAVHGPLMLLLDDCHLFDTPSWLLLAQLAEAQVGFAFCMSISTPQGSTRQGVGLVRCLASY